MSSWKPVGPNAAARSSLPSLLAGREAARDEASWPGTVYSGGAG